MRPSCLTVPPRRAYGSCCAFDRRATSSSSDLAQTNSSSSPPASGWRRARRRRHIARSVGGRALKGSREGGGPLCGLLPSRPKPPTGAPPAAGIFFVGHRLTVHPSRHSVDDDRPTPQGLCTPF